VKYLRQLQQTYKRFQSDQGLLMAAAVSYYTALSLFPLLLVLTSGLGYAMRVTQWGQNSEQQVLTVIGNYASPAVRQNVKTMLERVQEGAGVGGPLGVVMLVFTSVALFAHFERAFDQIWQTRTSTSADGVWGAIKNALLYRLRAFLLLLAMGVLILVIFLAGITLESLQKYTEDLLPKSDLIWRGISMGASIALNTLVFTLIYKWLPKTTVRWSEAARGAVLAAILWELGRWALTSFIVADKYSAYGVIGSFMAVMLWIYYAVTMLFLGAEYVQVICRHCNSSVPSAMPS
jgi:membrane protein